MSSKRIPKFYGLRVYMSSVILYFFLVIPFIGFIIFQNVPRFIENNRGAFNQAGQIRDSIMSTLDSVPDITEAEIDSMVAMAIRMADLQEDTTEGPMAQIVVAPDSLQAPVDTARQERPSLVIAGPGSGENDDPDMFDDEGPFSRYFLLLFALLTLSFLLGLAYNLPFKRYFRKKRKGREIPDKLHAFCKKHLLRTPWVNSLILIMPNVVVFIYSMVFLMGNVSFDEEVERSMFVQLHYLTLVATTLEFLFVYYWQKHRVHIRYIHHVFSAEELRKRIFRQKGGKIRNRFMVASGMTTFLPLLIVLVYLILSLTSIREFEQEEFSKEQKEILFGPWSTVINAGEETLTTSENEKLFYVNAIDSIVMLVGIGNGILVSFIYLLLFLRWTNRDISGPLKELLVNIQNTRGGKAEQYTIVRTNDEIGELAEGYNEMTRQIHEYVESISTMNRELEEKVRERTREVVEQKEEIETQKEEIEAQLDLATLQRDTIANQKDQILDSIYYAERIQAAILPPTSLLAEHLREHFLLFRPRDIVSGDFYWTTEKNNKLLVAVADCTGHGVPGAFLSLLGISSLNEIVNRSRSLEPHKILELLRERLIRSLHQTGTRGEAQDGIEIALCVIDLKNNTLDYAGANRPLYLLRDEAVEQIRPDRMPIGIYEQELVPFSSQRMELKKGDCLYLFSDGFVDQLGGPLRKTFRVRRFRKLLLEIRDQSMESQKERLESELKAWQGDVEQIDDILVLGIRI